MRKRRFRRIRRKLFKKTLFRSRRINRTRRGGIRLV